MSRIKIDRFKKYSDDFRFMLMFDHPDARPINSSEESERRYVAGKLCGVLLFHKRICEAIEDGKEINKRFLNQLRLEVRQDIIENYINFVHDKRDGKNPLAGEIESENERQERRKVTSRKNVKIAPAGRSQKR